MPKTTTRFVCQQCAYESPRWLGRCPQCDGWNTFSEEISLKRTSTRTPTVDVRRVIPLNSIESVADDRVATGIREFDRVLGGGLVRGSVVLLGGDPGVGKSTLVLQMASLAASGSILYVSGEESPKQIRLRADRLGVTSQSMVILAETNMDVVGEILARQPPDMLIVDSIQTMYRSSFESSPGSVGQLRECTAFLTRIAKEMGIASILIGHVTKEGLIAGPKVIEHMVDAVLQFEGERHYSYRVLRAVKNRFGSTNEIGIFEMSGRGLVEVANPSALFLSQRAFGASGSCVVPTVEGTRTILIEVQALVTSSAYSMPQRNTAGYDLSRLALLIAVLDKRLGVMLGGHDVFINVTGGIRVDEPAVDLGVALAMVSSLRDLPLPTDCIVAGEIGLAGEVRAVGQIESRLQESAKLGFTRAVVPHTNLKGSFLDPAIEVLGVDTIAAAVTTLLP